MAVVNLTPDSFYDGGRWVGEAEVLDQCRRWVEGGAAVLDVGGESTRPGADPVDVETEQARILPLIRALTLDPLLSSVPVSVDTRHAVVAQAALRAGASIVNDISGLADPDMVRVVAEAGAGLVLGHLRGTPKTMQGEVEFEDLSAEIEDELGAGVSRAVAGGVSRRSILIDPGIGFGKSADHSAALVVSSRRLGGTVGCPVLIGASRKSFLGSLGVEDRGLASVVAAVMAAEYGAAVVRVHDVVQTVEALRVQRGLTLAALSVGLAAL